MFFFEHSWGIAAGIFLQVLLNKCRDCIPDIGWDIHPVFLKSIMIGRCSHVHTLARFVRVGVTVEMLLKDIDPEETMIVAHNLDFDLGILLNHANPEQKKKLRKMSNYDTMKMGTHICKLPNKNGFSDYKYPRLSELASHYDISTEDVQLHNAEADTEIMRKCFVKMRKFFNKLKK